ncbi:uncharacterized protein ms(3)76Ba isoform X2 [Drosophila pseudoobscura]|uniref:Uncharacterized protein ms(3)76Ba isoform X2 n=1 Tax=Drosophila pseudoobscura pseudoobscura TaxID=46245 RepID=A0A6I8UYA3_DROPS|nr:uncharacterized protein LOC6903020 isoform X2 [Drosophila pseudoobscura]
MFNNCDQNTHTEWASERDFREERFNESQDHFYFNYVNKQNTSLQKNQENDAEEKLASTFQAKEKPRIEDSSSPYPIITTPIWNRRHGPMPPTISTPEVNFMAKFVANKKAGVVRVAEIFDSFAWGRELKKRGFQSSLKLPAGFRRYIPKPKVIAPMLEPELEYLQMLLDEYCPLPCVSPISEAPQMPEAATGNPEIPEAVAGNQEEPAAVPEIPAADPQEPPGSLFCRIPTSEELSQMEKDFEAGLLDPNTWPFNCRMPCPTSPCPKWRYDNPPTPPPTPRTSKRSRLEPCAHENALAVNFLFQEEQKRAMKPSQSESQSPLLHRIIPKVSRGLRSIKLLKSLRFKSQKINDTTEIDEILNMFTPTENPRPVNDTLQHNDTAPADQDPEISEDMEYHIAASDIDVPLEVEQDISLQDYMPGKSTSLALLNDIPRTSIALQDEIPQKSQPLISDLCIEVAMPEDLPHLQQEESVPVPVPNKEYLRVAEEREPICIGNVQPKPQDKAECQQWILQTSQILTSQYKSLLWKDRKPVDIDFEDEIEKDQQNQRLPGIGHPSTLQENAWQRSYRSMLDVFEDICEETACEYRDPQAKRLRSKWVQRFGKSSSPNLCRKLDTKLPTVRSRPLLKVKIMAKKNIKNLETLTLRIELKYSKTFCTLHLNQPIHLKSAAKKLSRVEYDNAINVLQKFENHNRNSEHSRISWLWPNGTVTIINGCRDDKKDLIEVQNKLLSPLLHVSHFKAEPAHNLLYLRMRSSAHFGFQIKLKLFAECFVLSAQTSRDNVGSEYVYYVSSDLPGVVAQLHDHGRVYVYAMSIEEADKMLLKLYILIHNQSRHLVKMEPH